MKPDIELVQEIQNNINVNTNLKILYERYKFYITKKSYKLHAMLHIDQEELKSDIEYNAYQHIQHYIKLNKIRDTSKFRLSVYLRNAVKDTYRQHHLNSKKEKNRRNEVKFFHITDNSSDSEHLSDSEKIDVLLHNNHLTYSSPHDILIQKINLENIHNYIRGLRGRTKLVLLLAFAGKKRIQIGNELGMSLQAVSTIISKHEKNIYDCIRQ